MVTRMRNRVTQSYFLFKRKEDMGIEQGQSQSVGHRRKAMPTVAAFVDLCRTHLGAFVDVDAQMATAQQARREHAHVLAQQGEVAAARWHRANAHRCTFVATEGGRTIGLASPWGATTLVPTAASTGSPTPSDPPIGTPTASSRAGNSAPAAAPVAGLGESPSSRPKVQG